MRATSFSALESGAERTRNHPVGVLLIVTYGGASELVVAELVAVLLVLKVGEGVVRGVGESVALEEAVGVSCN